MLGKYGPYGQFFTDEQAVTMSQESFFDEGIVFPPAAASPFPQ